MSSIRTPLAPLSNSPLSPTTASFPQPSQPTVVPAPIALPCGHCSKCLSCLPPTPRTASRRGRTRTTSHQSSIYEDEAVPKETPDLQALIQQIRDVLSPYDLSSPSLDDDVNLPGTEEEEMASSLYIVGQGLSALPASVPIKLQTLLRQYTSSEPDFAPYAYFPPSEAKGEKVGGCAGYTRNLVDRGNGEYNLLVLCWPEGASSQVHDHPGAHCIVKMLSGSLREIRYRRETKGEALVQTSNRVLERDQVCYMHDKFGLHSMHNDTPSSSPAISLHLYSPPIPLCHVFSLTDGEAKLVDCSRVESTCGVRGATPEGSPK